jgi:acetyl-CoA carboxylase biotin carboxyl carrier protein
MKRKKPTKSSPSFAKPEIQYIEQLLQFMSEHNLEEFEYSNGELRIRLRKPSAGVVVGAPRAMAAPEIIVPGSTENPLPSGGATQTADARSSEDLHLVKSPIVGTFYEAPSPGAEPFVRVGTYIEAGKVLCVVEAMKLMNEIEAEVSGEIIRVFVENGQPVEYGQPLFGIRPSRKK